MTTTTCPKSHVELANVSKGKAYGHVPGHTYHDVDVIVSRNDKGTYRVHVVESWGSAQGRDEEHGRREIVARETLLSHAVRVAEYKAKEAGITCEYLTQALSLAEDAAVEAIEDNDE